tara:strand:+ start:386 stop:1075 length:690 start_codon:yes stop_codon:yes gene_type:complete
MGIRRGSISTPIIADGLVFNMDFANRASYPKTGTTATDTINSLTGTLSSTPTFDTDAGGNFDLDGTDYIDIGAVTEMNSTTKMTISYWCKKSASNKDMVIGSQLSGTNGFWLQWYSDGNVYWNPRNGSSYSRSYALTYTSDWICLTGTYDGSLSQSSRCKTYVNGVLVLDGTGTPPADFSSTAGNSFRISGLGGSFYSDGNVANVHLYNRALSANEVLHNYNALKSRFE